MSKITVFHRYKWTLEEKVTLAIPTIILLAFNVMALVQDHSLSTLLIIFDVVWIGAAALLVNIGLSKKKKSRLEAIYDEEDLFISVDGNKLYKHGTNKGNLDKFTSLLIKQVGQNPTMILRSKDQDIRNLSIPLRLVSKDGFYAFMETNVLNNANIVKDDQEATEKFFADAKNYKR